MSAGMHLVQVRRAHGRYETIHWVPDLAGAIWSAKQHLTADGQESVRVMLESTGEVLFRAVPKAF